MAPLKIYWGGGSPPAWRVLACLEEKGLAYDSKLLDLYASESQERNTISVVPMALPSFAQDRVMPYVIVLLCHVCAGTCNVSVRNREPAR